MAALWLRRSARYPAMTPKARALDVIVPEQQRGEDVDGREHGACGAYLFEDRVAEDQHAEAWVTALINAPFL